MKKHSDLAQSGGWILVSSRLMGEIVGGNCSTRRRRRRQPAPSRRRRTSPAGSANAFGTGKSTKLSGVAGERRGRSDAPVE